MLLFAGGWGSPGLGATLHPLHAKSSCQTAHCTAPTGGICLQPSLQDFLTRIVNVPILFVAYTLLWTQQSVVWQSLSCSLGPCGYHYMSHWVFWLILPLAGCWVRLWCQQCVYLFGPEIKSKQCSVSSNDNAKTIVTRAQGLKYWHSKRKSVCGQLLNVKFLFLNVLNEIWENCWEISQK